MVAFSKTKIQGIIATTHTFNSNIFRYFLHQLSLILSEDYVLIWDKSKIHTAKIVQDFAIEHKLMITTISAYWPFINSWDKLILIIKSKVRRIEREGKEISLSTFMKIVIKIESIQLEWWLVASFKEVINRFN